MPTTITKRRSGAGGVPVKKTRTQLNAERQAKAEALASGIVADQAQAAVLAAKVRADRTELSELMTKMGRKTLDFEHGETGELVHVNQQATTSTSIDEGKLRTKLGATLWRKVTRAVLDTGLLEQAVANGDVNPVDVAQCSDTSTSTPFVKVSTKGAPKGGKR